MPHIPYQGGVEEGLKSRSRPRGLPCVPLQASEQLHGFSEDQPGIGGQATHAGNLSGGGGAWGHIGWHCAHGIAGGWDLPMKCHCALGLGKGVGQGGQGTAVCCASQDCLSAHTVSLLSWLPLAPPSPLPPSPIRPLLATAGSLQLRLSLCVFSLALASSSAETWGCWGPGRLSLPTAFLLLT